MNGSSKKVLKLGISVGFIVIGIYMTFIHKSEPPETVSMEKTEETEIMGGDEAKMKEQHDYTQQELPAENNISDNETYNDGKIETEIYFSNTEQLDAGNLPFEAQAVLCREVQTYLRHSGYDDVTELYIGDYEETKGEITILCYMDGYTEQLMIEYIEEEQKLKYSIIKN